MTNVLITGGAGFIGCNYAARLLTAGHRVTLLDNLSRKGTAANLRWLQAHARAGTDLRFIEADVRDADALRSSVLLVLQRTPEFRIEYVAVRDPSRWTAEEPHGAMQQAVCLVALWLSGVRLIDNLRWDAPA